ncbi:MAG: NAD(P)H-hydrate dehydratase [Candidatus Micrarchaeia archaeon]
MAKIISALWKPKKHSHKGENGKLFMIGGSRQYHGAPVFSLLAARRFVDLPYFYPGEQDSGLIASVKKNVPEAIVISKLDGIKNCDCTLFGIGLGKANADFRKIVKNSKRIVIDGDGLRQINGNWKILSGKTIITPHEGEFKYLFGASGTKANVIKMADKYGVVILKKDPNGDIITDGRTVRINKIHNQGMTKGGTGDVLSGLCAALFCKNDAMASAYMAAKINGLAGNRLKKKFGYNFSATDLANEVAMAARH